ncbi:winged helix domain-containing protein, partial [Acinetobacter baumannii]
RVGDNCFVNGQLMDTDHIEAVDALCQYDYIDKQHLGDALADPKFVRLLTQLVNQGYWYFED